MLATKNNLVRKGVVIENNMCVLCGMEEDSCSHAAIKCRLAWLVQSQCYAWLGLADHFDPRVHFQQFRLCNALESVNMVWRTIWIAIVSGIWSLKNKIIFKGGVMGVSEVFALIHLKVWSWVISKVSLVYFSYSNRCLEPLVCMNMIQCYFCVLDLS